MPKCRRDARFLFARKRCPTGGLILEGAQKKPFETKPFLSGFGINWRQKQWLWHALAPPNKAKRKGLQRHGRRCQVCHRSRLKEAKKLSEPRIPIGFLAWLWNALAPQKPRGKGLQRRGQRRRVFQRSRLKDRCPNAGVMLDFFLQEKGAQLEVWFWRVLQKSFLNQGFQLDSWPGFEMHLAPQKPRGKGLQRRGQRRRVYQRSRLKDRCPNAGVMLDFFLQEKGAQLEVWFWRVLQKSFLNQGYLPIGFFLARLWNALAPPKTKRERPAKGWSKAPSFPKEPPQR